jgi:hypothetical protein
MPHHSPYAIKLSADERTVLEKRSRARSACYSTVVRARIVLMSADGYPSAEIAARLGVHLRVVGRWRKRFLESGVSGLADRPGRGEPRSSPAETVTGVEPLGGAPSTVREIPLPLRSPADITAQVLMEGSGVPVVAPGVAHGARRPRERPARRSHCPYSSTSASTAQVLPFGPRYSDPTRDALRSLVSSINRYLDETDAEVDDAGRGTRSPRRPYR